MKLKFLFLICSFLVAFSSANAQCKEFTWPEDKAKADECVAIWGDAIKQANYRSATSSLQWMLTKAPKWNTKLYIDAADVYDKLAEKETDPAKKKILVDSLILIYEMRVTNCGDELNVINRKAYACFKYYRSKEKIQELLTLYDKVYEMSGTNVSDGNIVAYMKTVENYQKLHKNLTDDQILQRYDKIMSVIEFKKKKATEQNKTADLEKLKSYSDAVESILIGLVKINCDFVKKNLAPKFKQNPNDLAVVRKIFKFMLDDKCTDDPLWLEAAEAFLKLNPEKDFAIVKAISAQYMSKGDYNKAESILKEHSAIATTANDKQDLNLLIGAIEVKKGNYPGARAVLLQAGTKAAYEKIGDLYFNSFDTCAKKANVAEDRLVYIAAYEMYQKAGSSSQMARAKAQFPSREEIFLLNWSAGSTQKVGCWINESVTLQTRD